MRRRLLIGGLMLGLAVAFVVSALSDSAEPERESSPVAAPSPPVASRVTPVRPVEPTRLELPELPTSPQDDRAPVLPSTEQPTLAAPQADASVEAPLTPAPASAQVALDQDAGDVLQASPSPDATPARPDDKRFTIRWDDEGACAEKPRVQLKPARDALLASFVERRIGDAVFLHDPRVDPSELTRLFARLQSARVATAAWIDWAPNTPPPATIVYRTSEQLRSVACVNEQTVGYYDGRLHVSADPELPEPVIEQTVVHEYLHFALNQVGVSKPMWLHEGLAMHVAEETWFTTSRLDFKRWLQTNKLPFEGMVFAFPHTADEKFALVAYYQSFRMVDFVMEQRGPAGIRSLVTQLSSKSVTAEDAFVQGAGLSASTLEAQWQLFVR
ncbi:MAG: hypothetical protein Q8L14_23325 [Myxococcales bacterium]|nr:hypothetical protein [Myxococcales bacterium]